MRVTTVNKAQKDQGTCRRCRQPIVKGESYRWAKGRYSARRVIHVECGDPPKTNQFLASELTDNDKLATLYAAQENAADQLGALDLPKSLDDTDSFVEDVTTILSDCSEQADEAREMYEESASNIEEGFGHETSASEEQREGASTVESWQNELTGPSFDDPPEAEESDDLDDELETWAQDVIQAANDIVDGLEL